MIASLVDKCSRCTSSHLSTKSSRWILTVIHGLKRILSLPKMNKCPWKRSSLKGYVIFQPSIFRGHLSFQRGKVLCKKKHHHSSQPKEGGTKKKDMRDVRMLVSRRVSTVYQTSTHKKSQKKCIYSPENLTNFALKISYWNAPFFREHVNFQKG